MRWIKKKITNEIKSYWTEVGVKHHCLFEMS